MRFTNKLPTNRRKGKKITQLRINFHAGLSSIDCSAIEHNQTRIFLVSSIAQLNSIERSSITFVIERSSITFGYLTSLGSLVGNKEKNTCERRKPLRSPIFQGHPTRKIGKRLRMQFSAFSYPFMAF